MRCYIGLGSNLEAPGKQLERALNTLRRHPAMHLTAVSHFYGSEAVGPGEQPDYVNAVAELHTELAPHDLLHALQTIEQQQGRTRALRWGARTLDLDILLYGDDVIDSPDLSIPHPRLQERPFVLVPLEEIAPDLKLPNGTCLSSLLDYASRQKVWQV